MLNEISATKTLSLVKLHAYKNGQGRYGGEGELIVGSTIQEVTRSIDSLSFSNIFKSCVQFSFSNFFCCFFVCLKLLDQATVKLELRGAARKLYTEDGTLILDVQDLVDWVIAFYRRELATSAAAANVATAYNNTSALAASGNARADSSAAIDEPANGSRAARRSSSLSKHTGGGGAGGHINKQVKLDVTPSQMQMQSPLLERVDFNDGATVYSASNASIMSEYSV